MMVEAEDFFEVGVVQETQKPRGRRVGVEIGDGRGLALIAGGLAVLLVLLPASLRYLGYLL